MKIFAITNQKGGVGKTTTAVNIGACLSDHGRKVLLIDLDAQSSLSCATGLEDIESDDMTVYEVLKGEDINHAVVSSDRGFDVLPTDIRLSGADIELSSTPGREFLLREAIEDLIKEYDVILIDCPPSLGVLTLMGLTAADRVLIPVKADYYGLKGLSQLSQSIDVVKRRMNPDLKISGVLLTFYNPRRKLDQQIEQAIKKFFGEKLLNSKIGQNTALAEAPVEKSDIFGYDANSKGAKQYAEVTKELIEREGI